MRKPGGKLSVTVLAVVVLFSLASATDLQNIESITPQGSQNININGTLDLNGNNPILAPTLVDGVDLDNPGNALVINSNQYEVDSSSIGTSELNTGDVDNRYLNRGGDSMTGNLNLNGNDITNSDGGALRGFAAGYGSVLEMDTIMPSSNYLANAHKWGTIQQVSGGAAERGSPSVLFNHKQGWERWQWQDNSDFPVEINIKNIGQNFLRTCYLDFQSGTPDSVLIEVYDPNDVQWKTYANITSNSRDEIIIENSQMRFAQINVTLNNGGSGDVGFTEFACTTESDNLGKAWLNVAGDKMYGNINMNSNSITNLASPSSGSDAATKSYVDNNEDTVADDQTLSTTADTSGTNDDITISNGNTITVDDDFEADTNTQLDDEAATSNVDAGGNRVENVADPNSDDDAVNRGYADSRYAASSDYYWTSISLETGDYKISNGTTGSISVPGSGSTSCDGGVCIRNAGGGMWGIETATPPLPMTEANMPGRVCWGYSAGDNEQNNQEWGAGIRSTMTDANGHCMQGSSIGGDCAASYLYDSSTGSHDTYGVVCKTLD